MIYFYIPHQFIKKEGPENTKFVIMLFLRKFLWTSFTNQIMQMVLHLIAKCVTKVYLNVQIWKYTCNFSWEKSCNSAHFVILGFLNNDMWLYIERVHENRRPKKCMIYDHVFFFSEIFFEHSLGISILVQNM